MPLNLWRRIDWRLRYLLIAIIAVYACICGYVYWIQRDLLFDPVRDARTPKQAGFEGAQVLNLHSKDQVKLIAWFKPPRSGKRVILYLHGKSGSLASIGNVLQQLSSDGDGVLAVDYRGYGDSSGSPSESGLLLDGEEAYEALLAREYWPDRIIIYGHSLGTGVAVDLASHHKVAAVILEAPFSSAQDVAAADYWWLPVALLMRDPFYSDQKIQKIQSPLLILHGTEDQVIPIRFGKKLFALAPQPKSFIEEKGLGHSLILRPGVYEQIQRWLNKVLPDG